MESIFDFRKKLTRAAAEQFAESMEGYRLESKEVGELTGDECDTYATLYVNWRMCSINVPYPMIDWDDFSGKWDPKFLVQMHKLMEVPEQEALYWADFTTDSGGHHVFLLNPPPDPRHKKFLEASLNCGGDEKYIYLAYWKQNGFQVRIGPKFFVLNPKTKEYVRGPQITYAPAHKKCRLYSTQLGDLWPETAVPTSLKYEDTEKALKYLKELLLIEPGLKAEDWQKLQKENNVPKEVEEKQKKRKRDDVVERKRKLMRTEEEKLQKRAREIETRERVMAFQKQADEMTEADLKLREKQLLDEIEKVDKASYNAAKKRDKLVQQMKAIERLKEMEKKHDELLAEKMSKMTPQELFDEAISGLERVRNQAMAMDPDDCEEEPFTEEAFKGLVAWANNPE